jgi:hypothetical protein
VMYSTTDHNNGTYHLDVALNKTGTYEVKMYVSGSIAGGGLVTPVIVSPGPAVANNCAVSFAETALAAESLTDAGIFVSSL